MSFILRSRCRCPSYTKNFKKGNTTELLDFLVSKGVWNTPEVELKIMIKLKAEQEQIEIPLHGDLSPQQIADTLAKLGFTHSDFKSI